MRNWNVQASVGLVCILGLCAGCGGCGIGMMNGGIEYSEGYREGTIQKFSHKGVIWKTYEGELAMAGFQQHGGEQPTMSNVFEFTVADSEVIKEFQSVHANENVRLYYKQFLCTPPWKGSTGYFIYKGERLK